MSPVPVIPESLEDALHAVVYESALPAKSLAAGVGVRYGYLAEAANPTREDTQFQARLIVPLTKASGNDAIVRYMAHAVGGLFVRLQPASTAMDAQTAVELREFAEYLAAKAESNADGIVTRQEFDRERREAMQVIEAILAHIATQEARVIANESAPPALKAVPR